MTRPSMVLIALALLAGAGQELPAQSIAQRVGRVRNGTVRFSFASRPDVCGNSRGGVTVRSGDRSTTVSPDGSNNSISRRRDEWVDECEPGPVRVAMDLADGHVVAVRSYVGGRWRSPGDADDIGTVPPREASDYLLDLATRGDGRGSRDAIFPATLAEGVVTWPRLIAIGKNESIEREVRRQAIFWVGQAAEEKATEGLQGVIGDRANDSDVRTQAVFALSQRPRDEAVPALINIARTSKDPEVRKSAIFWLAGTRDPRALDYFESILKR